MTQLLVFELNFVCEYHMACISFKLSFNMTLPDHIEEKTLICTLFDLKTITNLYIYSTVTLAALILNGLVKW